MLGIFSKFGKLLSAYANKLSTNNTVTANGNQVSYNGKVYSGKSIVVENGKVYVDGVFVDKTKQSRGCVVVSTSSSDERGNKQSVNINL